MSDSSVNNCDDITARLDEIVSKVRSKDTSLERSLDLFDEAIELAQRLHAFIAATVIDHRHRQLWFERRKNGRQEMRWRDKIDVLHAVVDQPQENFPQVVYGYFFPEILL